MAVGRVALPLAAILALARYGGAVGTVVTNPEADGWSMATRGNQCQLELYKRFLAGLNVKRVAKNWRDWMRTRLRLRGASEGGAAENVHDGWRRWP